ncbi:MAG: MFS transporter [Alphaproteobacteria bacterium]
MSGLERFGAMGSALSNRNFAIYTAGTIPSVIGVWVQRVAVGWLTWEMTKSGTWLGLMGFADLFPMVVVGPFAGVISDRFDRLAIAKVVQLVAAAQAITLTVLAFAGLVNEYVLFALTLVAGLDQAFYQPVRSAMTPNLVPRRDLPAAIAINSAAWNAARFIGPAIAGIILVTGEAAYCFVFNAVTYISLLVSLWCVRLTPDAHGERVVKGMLAEMTEGCRYAFTHPVIGPMLITLGIGAVFARPVVELLPGFAGGIFDRGAEGLAWLTSAMGVGAMTGALWLGQRGRLQGLVSIAVFSLAGAACLLLIFTGTAMFEVAVLTMIGTGFIYTVTGTTIQTVVQAVAEPTLRGRVLGLYGMIWIGGASIGALIMGVLSEWFGLRVPVAGGAFVCLAAWVWGMRVRRRVADMVERQ